MLTLSARLRSVIEAETDARGRFAFLGERSNVPAATWRTWWTRGATPSGSLLEAAANLWPQYALWLTTGCTDVRCGHIKPRSAVLQPFEGFCVEAGIAVRTECSETYLKQLQSAPRSPQEADTIQGAAALAALRVIAAHRAAEIARNFEFERST